MVGTYPKILLNGVDVSQTPTISLRAGENRLFLVSNVCVGGFLRVLKPGTKDRLTDIRFEPPTVSTAGGDVYIPPVLGPPERKALSGKWRARLVRKLPPASAESKHPDTGITAEAARLVGIDVEDSSWEERDVPRRWKDYPGDWPAIDGEAVFRKAVTIPNEWAGKPLNLSLGPIDDFDDTFFNGAPVGRTDKSVPDFYNLPRRYTVPAPLVRPGKNVIAVRVFDHFGDGGFTGSPLEIYLAPTEWGLPPDKPAMKDERTLLYLPFEEALNEDAFFLLIFA